MSPSEGHDRFFANERLAQETSGLFLGAMPPDQFLHDFLPLVQDAPECRESTGPFKEVVSGTPGEEVPMYESFVSMVLVSVSSMPR
jgi:hypothetical protein